MSDPSNDQFELIKPSKKNATIWAVIVGVVTAGLVFSILSSQSFLTRVVAGIVSGVAVAVSSYRKTVAAMPKPSEKADNKSE